MKHTLQISNEQLRSLFSTEGEEMKTNNTLQISEEHLKALFLFEHLSPLARARLVLYLADHEVDIVDGINDFEELSLPFTQLFSRHPTGA